MKFEPGKSGNPSGRPRGAKGRSTVLREQLATTIEKEGAKVLKKAVEMALAGEASVMNALLDRMLPKLKPIAKAAPMPIDASATAEKNAAAVLGAMAEGGLSIEDGTALLAALNQVATIERFGDLERALAELFKATGRELPPALAARVARKPETLQ